MQRRLMIMRHAKSAWSSDVASDHERPLNKRGRRDAPRVGKRLAKLGWVPEFVVSSDSRRTRETWERMQRRFPEVRVSTSGHTKAGAIGGGHAGVEISTWVPSHRPAFLGRGAALSAERGGSELGAGRPGDTHSGAPPRAGR
jgi:hypothetical protein